MNFRYRARSSSIWLLLFSTFWWLIAFPCAVESDLPNRLSNEEFSRELFEKDGMALPVHLGCEGFHKDITYLPLHCSIDGSEVVIAEFDQGRLRLNRLFENALSTDGWQDAVSMKESADGLDVIPWQVTPRYFWILKDSRRTIACVRGNQLVDKKPAETEVFQAAECLWVSPITSLEDSERVIVVSFHDRGKFAYAGLRQETDYFEFENLVIFFMLRVVALSGWTTP